MNAIAKTFVCLLSSLVCTFSALASCDFEIQNFSMTCNEGENSANIDFDLTSGEAPFDLTFMNPAGQTLAFTLDNGVIRLVYSSPMMGTYEISIMDNSGCSTDTLVNFMEDCFVEVDFEIDTTIVIEAEMNLTDPIVTGAFCGTCNGSIKVQVGEAMVSEFNYSLDGGQSWQTSNYFENLCPDDYLIMASHKTNNDLSFVTTAQIAETRDLKILNIELDCKPFQNTAEVKFELAEGAPEYHLFYINPIGQNVDAGSSFDSSHTYHIENPIEGEYQFFVEDRLGCVKDTLITFLYDCTQFPLGGGSQIPTDWELGVNQMQGGSTEIRISKILKEELLYIEIYNSSGQHIYYKKVQNITSWSERINLERGTYFLVLNSNRGIKKVHKYFVFE